ncbi:MAG: NfeD family protein [Bacteroidia bacterium]|nr:NfeD family protein [Bacteroidia bacterium]
MTLTGIILLIALALVLLVIEILFVPGMILGTISFLMMCAGVYLAYREHGDEVGHIVFACTALAGGGLTWWAFKTDVWTKVSVNTHMDGRANLIEHLNIKDGDTGQSVSRLAPMGKALLNGHLVEVQAFEGFIDENREIIVHQVSPAKIIVKLKT